MSSSEGTKAQESEQILSHIKDHDLATDDPDLIEAVLPCFGFNAETRLPQGVQSDAFDLPEPRGVFIVDLA